MRRLFNIFQTYFILLFATSCATYTIPKDSFRAQFGNMANEDFHEVYVRGPVGDSYSYKTFKRDSIQCIDKNGTETFLVKKPSLEMRITEKNGKKTIFYFDRIQVIDDNIIGHQSRFAGSLTKTISIGSISLIEIQDGKKNFKYVEK